MKQLLVILLILYLSFELAGISPVMSDEATCTHIVEVENRITGRRCTIFVFKRNGTISLRSGLLSFDASREFETELTEEAAKKVSVGSSFPVYDIINEMRGRSNLGKAWDWLKKPREAK